MRMFATDYNGFGSLRRTVICLVFGMFAVSSALAAATRSLSLPVVPKWQRFEGEFSSVSPYAHPLQDVTLTVQFTSPLGETTQVFGFWDGGRTWRVRFAPDQPGRWKFKTVCSDAANMGLNDRTGEFLCTASLGQSRFYRHGRIQITADGQHLEHADGTPFFWLADNVWNGAQAADPKSWEIYGLVRASQNFSVAQWSVLAEQDYRGESALTGFPESISVNPDFFRRLDAKIATSKEIGILSAIVPLGDAFPEAGQTALPDDQAALLVRYVVARWGADPVSWVIPLRDGHKDVQRWKKIGQEVFAGNHHAPVLVVSPKDPNLLTEYRDQDWVDLLGFQAPLPAESESLRAVLTGEALDAGSKNLRHPLIAFTPEENAPASQSGARITASEIRRSAYWGVLQARAAGLSYSGHGVANWDTTVGPKAEDRLGAGLPFWHKALFMPGAKQMGHISKLLAGLPYWQLRPEPRILSGGADNSGASKTIFAASTTARDLALVYVADDRMLELAEGEMPRAPAVTWYNPRHGDTSPGVAVVVQRTCQFPTPEPGDWLLLIKAGK